MSLRASWLDGHADSQFWALSCLSSSRTRVMPRRMASLRDGNVFWTASSKCCRKMLGTSNHIFEKLGLVCLFFNSIAVLQVV